jgi:hypothetical protein
VFWIKINRTKYIHFKNILHHSCLCIEPNTEADIDIIAGYDNIDFISQIRLNAAGDG